MYELTKVRGDLGFRLIGYVVIPAHVYLLIGEPRGEHLRSYCID